MEKIIRFLKGHVQIRITGQEPIRFLNLCKMRGIMLWNITYHKQKIEACIRIQDYFLLHDILRKTGTRATVIKKNGMPFFIPVIKKKIIFILAVVLVFLYLWNMSNYIWRIECVGNQMITTECLMDFFKEHQVVCGMKKEAVDIEELEFELRKTFPRITWVCISFQETKMLVSVKENTYFEKEEESAVATGSNLIADKDGTIISMITRKGIPCVKNGDTVNKGDILVEGNVPIYDINGEVCSYQLYQADATIIAKTKETYRHSIDNIYVEKVYTGKERDILTLVCYDRAFTMPSYPILYQNYEIITQKTQFKLFHNFYLPFYRYKHHLREYVNSPRKYTAEECENILNQDLEKIMLSFQQKGVQIIQKNVRIKENIKKTELIADFVIYERIGVSDPIPEGELDIPEKISEDTD